MLKEAQSAITSMATSTTAPAIPNMVTLKTATSAIAAITTVTRAIGPVVADPGIAEEVQAATMAASIEVSAVRLRVQLVGVAYAR